MQPQVNRQTLNRACMSIHKHKQVYTPVHTQNKGPIPSTFVLLPTLPPNILRFSHFSTPPTHNFTLYSLIKVLPPGLWTNTNTPSLSLPSRWFPRSFRVHRSRPCIDPEKANQHQSCGLVLEVELGNNWKLLIQMDAARQTTVKSVCTLHEQMCASVRAYHMPIWAFERKCVGQRGTHKRAHTNRIQRAVQGFKRGYGWVCAARDCNQLQSVGAACSNQRHKCQLLSPAHASICIH